jgi:hypothetical protein
MEGQEGVEVRVDTHVRDLNLVRVDQDRTGRVLKGVDGYLTDAVDPLAVKREAHVGRELKGEGVEEVLEIAEHSTVLCAGVSGRVVHCPSYLFSHTHTTQANTAVEAIR